MPTRGQASHASRAVSAKIRASESAGLKGRSKNDFHTYLLSRSARSIWADQLPKDRPGSFEIVVPGEFALDTGRLAKLPK
jgi:hypothetical protein